MGGGGQTQKTELPKWAEPYAKEWLGGFSDTVTPGGKPGAYPLPNQNVADMTPEQLAAFRNAGSLAGSGPGSVSGMFSAFGPEAQNNLLDPYVRKAQENTIAQYQDTIAPDIVSRAAQTGTLGSANHLEASQNAQANLSHTLGDIDVGIREPAFENIQNRSLQATQGQLAGQLNANQALLGAGNQEQQQQQNVLDTAYKNAYNEKMWPFEIYDRIAGDFGGIMGNQSTTKISGGK